jgi:dihydrofolate reductase
MEKQTHITMIYAVAKNGVIGRNNDLPWKLPSDLKRFKKLTSGMPMIMGSNTFSSLPGILPGRLHIVVSSADSGSRFQGNDNVVFLRSIQEVFSYLEKEQCEKATLIGGANLYKQFLNFNLVDTVIQTKVLSNIDGDTFMEELPAKTWKLEQTITPEVIGQESDTSKDQYPYEINIFQKS